MNLSPHFTLEELVASSTAARLGIDNTAPAVAVANLTALCLRVLEPMRSLLVVPLHIDSGYRCRPLNTAVRGKPNSAHLEGRAADVIPIGMSQHEALEMMKASAIPFDQCLIEFGWLHVSIPRAEDKPRRMTLAAVGDPNDPTFVPA